MYKKSTVGSSGTSVLYIGCVVPKGYPFGPGAGYLQFRAPFM